MRESPPVSIQAAIDDLSSPDPFRRMEAVLQLGPLGRARAKAAGVSLRIQFVLEEVAARDPDPVTRSGALQALQSIREMWEQSQALKALQLEYLLEQTREWPESSGRAAFVEKLDALKRELRGAIAWPAPAASLPAVLPVPVPASAGAEAIATASPQPQAPPLPTRPEKATVPFDQWLLSEGNLKLALYSGAVLLVLAGLIFVGVNWVYLPGFAKLATTSLITGLAYAAGYLLLRRPALRTGGIALTALASGFLPLQFAVLQIYILAAQGLPSEAIWLVGSLLCGSVYAITAYRLRAAGFSFAALLALVTGVTAGLILLRAEPSIALLTYSLVNLVLLLAAHALWPTRLSALFGRPLFITSQVFAVLLFIAAIIGWESCRTCGITRWYELAALVTVVLFYLISDLLWQVLGARWAAAFLFALSLGFMLTELGLSGIATGITLKGLALVYLGLGYVLERRTRQQAGSVPLYIVAYLAAAFVTLQSFWVFSADLLRPTAEQAASQDNLAKALLADTVLLAVSAAIHRRYEWLYCATFVLIVPVFIYARLWLGSAVEWSLVLGGLLLVYLTLAYLLAQRRPELKWPFLSAAAALSLVVPAISAANASVTGVLILSIGVLYTGVALWLRRSLLLLPALAAGHLAVLAFALTFPSSPNGVRTLAAVYAALGVILVAGARAMRSRRLARWAWPLYLVGSVDLAAIYFASWLLGDLMAVAISVTVALVSFAAVWIEREALAHWAVPTALTYLGAAVFFGALFPLFRLLGVDSSFWPAFELAPAAFWLALAWPSRNKNRSFQRLYSIPLRRAGLVVLAISVIGAGLTLPDLWVALVLAAAGIVLLADALIHGQVYLGYTAVGLLVGMWGYLLRINHVTEYQGYVIPVGLYLLSVGWNERRRGRRDVSWIATRGGLLVLLLPTFYQSLSETRYAVLLLIESLLLLAWGVRAHTRIFIQLAVLSLIANGLAQFGPGFAALDRWIQIATIGALLLGIGLAGLFYRERLVSMRRALTEGWQRWET